MRLRGFIPVLATAVLVACGGGGDDSGSSSSDSSGLADVADKYVGTWVMCVAGYPSSADSTKVTMVGTKTAATSISYTYNESEHLGSTACAGTGTPGYSELGSIEYTGSKTVGTDVVDMGEATITSDNDSSTSEPRIEKDISLVSGTTLYYGDDSVGADGYPTALFTLLSFTKQ